jgi:hypothetical protein
MVLPAPGQLVNFRAGVPLTIPAPQPVRQFEPQPASLAAKR